MYSEISNNQDILNLPNQYIQDDKVEINIENIAFDERGLKLQEYAERTGLVVEALDNSFYKVDFDGDIIELQEKELKKHNPDVKKITVKDNKRLLSKNNITQPDNIYTGETEMEMDNEIENDEVHNSKYKYKRDRKRYFLI